MSRIPQLLSLLGYPVTTLSEVTANLGLGLTSARNLADSGLLGPPLFEHGRQKFYDAKRAERVIAERRRARQTNKRPRYKDTEKKLEARSA